MQLEIFEKKANQAIAELRVMMPIGYVQPQ